MTDIRRTDAIPTRYATAGAHTPRKHRKAPNADRRARHQRTHWTRAVLLHAHETGRHDGVSQLSRHPERRKGESHGQGGRRAERAVQAARGRSHGLDV
eukprot:7390946-Prymnesium_polylepis.1